MSEIVLAHHGILGQKWGRKNGPPYPLEENDLSAAERKADTGTINRVRRDSKGRIIKDDYQRMSDSDLRKTVERMELENRYLRAADASIGKSRAEKLASSLSTVGTILDGLDKTSRFLTGESFVKSLTNIGKQKADDISDDNKDSSKGDKKDNRPFDSDKWLNKNINHKSESWLSGLGKTLGGDTNNATTESKQSEKQQSFNPNKWLNKNIDKKSSSYFSELGKSFVSSLGSATVGDLSSSSSKKSSLFDAESWLEKNIDSSKTAGNWVWNKDLTGFYKWDNSLSDSTNRTLAKNTLDLGGFGSGLTRLRTDRGY